MSESPRADSLVVGQAPPNENPSRTPTAACRRSISVFDTTMQSLHFGQFDEQQPPGDALTRTDTPEPREVAP